MDYSLAGSKYFSPSVFFPLSTRHLVTMKQRSSLMLRTVLTLILLPLFYTLLAVLETVRQINTDHTLLESQANSHFSGLPWLSGQSLTNAREIVLDRTASQFNTLHKDPDRPASVKFFDSRWRTLKTNMNKYELIDANGSIQYLGCRHIEDINIEGKIGRGYTKTVHKGFYKGTEIAVKSVQLDNEDIKHCAVHKSNRSADECFIYAKYKLAKEIIMLQQLQHTNIIKLLGFCWQNEKNTADLTTRGLTMMTEIGTKLDVIGLVQLPWQERFRLCLGLARLLQYLTQSPLGSLFIRDFKLSQFVLADGEIKLTDLDDVDNEEPRCLTNRDCVVRRTIGVNKTLQCNQGRCKDLIAAVNLENIGRYFFNHVLVPGSPEYLKEYLNEIKYNVQQLTWNSEALVWHMERVLYLLRSGKHLENVPRFNLYKLVPKADFPNLHDYYCPGTRLLEACELAAYDVREAQYKCDLDDSCKAFVMTEKTLWTGYLIVYLKNNTSCMQPNNHTSVYIKQLT